jgi:talin
VEQIADGEDIPNAEEFGLQIEGTERWLEAPKTLQENFVKDDDVLILARKFWFSDANCSLDSPKELHLLFVQAKGMVLRGILPTTREQAIDLAALGIQIRFGNFDPEKVNKKGWFLPQEYMSLAHYKSKKKLPDLEKDVAKEWKRKVGLTELNAKYRFLQTCRSLPTWGITHWRVEEKVITKKNAPPKWVPIRIGITRKTVLLLDEKTFEILKEWPIIKIKRWSASDQSFTLDFGDWEDEYFTCKTRQGGEIAAQLAGYIDILLKQRRQAPNLRTDDDAAVAKVTNIAVTKGHAAKARTMVTASGNSMQSADGAMYNGEQQYSYIPGQSPDYFGIPGLNQEMVDALGIEGAAHITDFDSALLGLDGFLTSLGTPLGSVSLPSLMSLQDLKQKFTESSTAAQRGAMGLVEMAIKGRIDRGFIEAEAQKIVHHIGAMTATAKLSAASDKPDMTLLASAAAISEACAKALSITRNLADGVDVEPQMAMWISQQAFKAAEMCSACAQQGYMSDVASKDLILESAKVVASTAHYLRTISDEGARGDEALLRAGKNVGMNFKIFIFNFKFKF